MKRDMSYLSKRGDVYVIDFRLPKKWGGKRLRVSLGTSDYITAAKIRDAYIRPILVMDSAQDVLREIARQILAFDKDAVAAISEERLNSIMNMENRKAMTWGDASENYCSWLEESSTLKPKTKEKYKMIARFFAQHLGGDSPVYTISKEKCAEIRDEMLEKHTSATTIMNYFVCVKDFVSWMGEHGINDVETIGACFKVDLPKVRKKSTQCIPHGAADIASCCLDGWTALPTILRYTGMRLNEALSCVREEGGCGIIQKEGIRCFYISAETCKTHIERFVPICKKLEQAMARDNFMEEAGETTTAITKKYNRRIKSIEGCEQAHIHSWRVYANTEMMEAGVDENLRRRILGHTSKDSHFVYSAARISAMKDALDKIG